MLSYKMVQTTDGFKEIVDQIQVLNKWGVTG